MELRNSRLYTEVSNKLSVDYKILDSSRKYFLETKRTASLCLVSLEDFLNIIQDNNFSGEESFKIVNNLRVEYRQNIQKNHFVVGEMIDDKERQLVN